MNRSAVLLAILLPLRSTPAQGHTAAFARVDSVMQDELRRTQTPGAALAVVSGDRVVYARGFGQTAGGPEAVPVRPATLFRIASVTKVFTAATLVTLAEAERVDLAEPIGTRLGELPEPLRRITPHQLLSHTAGLTMGPIPSGGSDPSTALGDASRQAPARAALMSPGELFSYSNLGYLLAGRVIEVAGGRPYAELVRQTTLAPLGMTATTFDSVEAARAGLARGYVEPSGGAAPPPSNGPETWPFAGLSSSVLDLSRFAIAFMNGGKLDGRQVLSPSAIARIATPVALYQSGEGQYGYGVRLYRHRGVDVVEHGGRGLDGYRSLLYMVPSKRVAVIMLANRAGGRSYALADAALDAVLGDALEPVAATPAAASMDSTEMARYVGRYVNGMALEIDVEGGVLTLHQGPAALPVRKLADGRFVAGTPRQGEMLLAFVRGPDGGVRYLHLNMRAFRRL